MKTIVDTNTPFGSYSEVSQSNPIRWAVYEPLDDTFVSKSGWLKCKDFFNDWVVCRQMPDSFVKYGFDSALFKKDPKSSGFLLVKDYSTAFEKNMELLNQWLIKDQKHSTIKVYQTNKSGRLLLELGPWYLRNTYNISLISFLIRSMSVEHQFVNWKEFLKGAYCLETDLYILSSIKTHNHWFKHHPLLKAYSWYSGNDYNSKLKWKENWSGIVHNLGVLGWSGFLKGKK